MSAIPHNGSASSASAVNAPRAAPRGDPFSKRVPSDRKNAADFIRALSEDFEKHGAAVIEKVRTDKPDVYLKVIAGLLPKDVNLNVRPLDELTDDQLLARLAQLTEMAKPLLAKLDGDQEKAKPEASRH